MYEKYKQYQYYVIIGICSLIATLFLPMLGSTVGLGFVFPNTAAGWIVYGFTKCSVAVINMMIFHCFMRQAKINVRDNEFFIAANKILREVKDTKELQPRSPRKWNTEQYGKKGSSIMIGSLCGAIGLTNAILTFDLVQMLTFIFVIIGGIIAGIIQMNNAEEYWTTEYYQYAKEIEKQHNEQVAAELAEAAKKAAAACKEIMIINEVKK